MIRKCQLGNRECYYEWRAPSHHDRGVHGRPTDREQLSSFLHAGPRIPVGQFVSLTGSGGAMERERREYRWQVTLKGDRLERVQHLAPRGKDWSCDIDPVG